MKGSGKACSALGDADVGELGDSEVEVGNLDKPYRGGLGMVQFEESDMSAHPDMWVVARKSSYLGHCEECGRGDIEAAKREPNHRCSRDCIPFSWNLIIFIEQDSLLPCSIAVT
jgi:hypothetical protein